MDGWTDGWMDIQERRCAGMRSRKADETCKLPSQGGWGVFKLFEGHGTGSGSIC